MQGSQQFFERYFPLLSGHNKAFGWQERLFECFCAGDIPSCVNIPTGFGKTSVMPIWLLALAYGSQSGGQLLPRRLVWVVNRRVVVDQATEEAQSIALRLNDSEPAELQDVRAALHALYGGRSLRGVAADFRPDLVRDLSDSTWFKPPASD
jgi:CRISPR-associated endonuclease/helicase Cas3